ncbi:hypothetical protein WKW80_05800 [Variovorax humicola]|uniref:DUF4240 domain-containing protein n=1 Tax=Variovorax humicola TaxID=1769758 RepID=A0ABU8VV66_9BURK
MYRNQNSVEIRSRDFWVKVVEMLQQNWALIDDDTDSKQCTVYFVDDLSRVFDRLPFKDFAEAEAALARNGFDRFADSSSLQEFLVPPEPPFVKGWYPSGGIYSSGQYWISGGMSVARRKRKPST